MSEAERKAAERFPELAWKVKEFNAPPDFYWRAGYAACYEEHFEQCTLQTQSVSIASDRTIPTSEEVSELQRSIEHEVVDRRYQSARRFAEDLAQVTQGDYDRAKLIHDLRTALAECAVPYEAILADVDSRKWIAPQVWAAIEEAVRKARLLLLA